jgi:putative ABC transport system permease protein
MRHILRLFSRTPLASAAALGALALAIGASTLVFSVVDGILLQPLGYTDPDRLVVVWESNVGHGSMENVVSPANFLYWRDRQHVFTDMAAISPAFRVSVTAPGQAPEMVAQQSVTAALFPLLGVSPAIGRAFTEAEDVGQKQLAVVSHRYFMSRLGGASSALGRVLQIDGQPYEVVGIMPSGFTLLDPDAEIWTTMGFTERSRTPRGRYLATVARLKPRMALQAAQAEMAGLMTELTRKFPEFDTGWSARVVPMHHQVTGTIRPALLLLLGAVGCVLLIACANVANLLLARGTARRRELAVRSALGASRARLVRQLLAESLLLSAIGGLAGWALAFGGLRWLKHVVTDSATVPRLADVSLDLRVVLFAVLASLTAALLAGLLPALTTTRLALGAALRDGVRGSTSVAGARVRPLLVGVEVALAVVLLSGAGLLVRSLMHVLDVNPGFTSTGVVTARLALSESHYATAESRTAFFDTVIAKCAALPGVASVGAVSFLPMSGMGAATSFETVGKAKPPVGQEPVTDVRIIRGDYFQTMRIPLLSGRYFQATDSGDRVHVIIINKALGDQEFPGQDPIGHELVINWDSSVPDRIVGVVGNVRHDNLETPVGPMIYWPHTRFSNDFMAVVVRTDRPAAALGPEMTRVVRSTDASVPLDTIRPMADLTDQTVSARRLVVWLLSIFAGLALVLAALGLYAVMTAVVAERRSELAIRVALGAGPTRVAWLVVAQALATTMGGAVAGLIAARFLSRLLEGLLFEVKPSDPWALGAALATLTAVAVLASAIPGRAAARVDPMEALKAE